MKAQHTPGPWYIQFMEPNDPGSDFWVKSDHNEVVHYGTDILCDDYGDHNGYPREQRMADAALIAEAPAFYDLCKKIEKSQVDGSFVAAGAWWNEMKEILNRIDK